MGNWHILYLDMTEAAHPVLFRIMETISQQEEVIPWSCSGNPIFLTAIKVNLILNKPLKKQL